MESGLLDPVFWFFCVGLLAGAVKSDLRIPPAVHDAIGIYLLLAIGLKGGMALHGGDAGELARPVLATLALGVAIPLTAYAILRRLGKFARVDAAALAAHYGSTSVITFAVAQNHLQRAGIGWEQYMVVLLVVLEIPAILVGIGLAKLGHAADDVHWGESLQEIFFGKSVLLLLGGLAIGWVNGPLQLEPLKAFFADPFKGVLALFMVGMGVSAAKRLSGLARAGLFLGAFAVLMPLLSALLGCLAARWVGLSVGGATLLATLAASASYIAAPAAIQIALPQANPTFYLVASLGITFPFNVTVGIRLYAWMAERIVGG